MPRVCRVVAIWGLMLLPAARADAQSTLPDAASRAKQALLAHDAQALVGQSSNLLLQIPGADPSSPLGRAQAVELLGRYLRGAEERGLDITVIREVEPGKGFVELTRRYVVSGTAEARRGTVFLWGGLEREGWRLAATRSGA